MSPLVRLHLVGDDEALDLVAELSRHLPIDELARTDVVPDRKLDERDVIVIGVRHPRTRAQVLRDALARGPARHVVMIADDPDPATAGARGIVAAAELVRLLLPARDPSA